VCDPAALSGRELEKLTRKLVQVGWGGGGVLGGEELHREHYGRHALPQSLPI
jgi:hypothetical protein